MIRFICYKFKWAEDKVLLMEIDRLLEYNDWLNPDKKPAGNKATDKANEINARMKAMKHIGKGTIDSQDE